MQTGYGYGDMPTQDHSNEPWRTEHLHVDNHSLDDPDALQFNGHNTGRMQEAHPHMDEVVEHLQIDQSMVLHTNNMHVPIHRSPQEVATLENDLIKSRRATVILANTVQKMTQVITGMVQSLGGHLDTTNMSAMLESLGSSSSQGHGFERSETMAIDFLATPAPKRRAARPRKSRKKPEDGVVSNDVAENNNEGQQSSMALIQTPIRAIATPRSANKKNGKMIYFGRAFLEFAMDHFEQITTGWQERKYTQGRPSKERSYASILSVLTFYRRNSIPEFSYFFDKACAVRSTDDAHHRYGGWIKKPFNPFNALNHGTFHLENGRTYRPLKQNELQFRDHAYTYISCFGTMQGPKDNQEFVLHSTPIALPPEVVADLQDPDPVELAKASPQRNTATTSLLPEFESYDQVDVADYVNNHHQQYATAHTVEMPDQMQSILVETSNDGNIDDFRRAISLRSNVAQTSTSLAESFGTPLLPSKFKTKRLLSEPTSPTLNTEGSTPVARNIFKKRKRTTLDDETTLLPNVNVHATDGSIVDAGVIETDAAEPTAKRSKTRGHALVEQELTSVTTIPSEPSSATNVDVSPSIPTQKVATKRSKPKSVDVSVPTAEVIPDIATLPASVAEPVPVVAKRARINRGQIVNPDGSYTPVAFTDDKIIYDNRVMTKIEAAALKAAASEKSVSKNATVASTVEHPISAATLSAPTKKRRPDATSSSEIIAKVRSSSKRHPNAE